MQVRDFGELLEDWLEGDGIVEIRNTRHARNEVIINCEDAEGDVFILRITRSGGKGQDLADEEVSEISEDEEDLPIDDQ